MSIEEYKQEVALLTILCGSKGLAEAVVLKKNKLKTPPVKGGI
jgi:hypothetical protein